MYVTGDTFTVLARQIPSADAREECSALLGAGYGEISDACAVTIAAQWQSPGHIGSTLAALASGAPVTVADVLDDIAATRREAREAGTLTGSDSLMLDMLATYVLQASA